ncbi:MAG: hypothetical protein HUU15_19530, partial [Candidatus Brocadiae bacterium]|nr:hypothetical protein [Candidatus Brocadiia bacterium]
EDAPAESEAPGKAAGRGPASSRLQKAPAPASTRSRRGAPPPPEEEHTGASSPGRRKIGFKEGGATIGTPMSKQSFMMWVVGGGAMFLIAIGLFSTLIIGRMKEKKAAEKQAVLAKASEQTLDRIYREDPNNLQAINEALKEFEESAKGTKMVGMIEEWQKKVAVRHTDVRLKKEANEELSVISGLLAQPGGGEAARRRLTKVVKSVAAVAWFGEEKRTYDSTLLSILRSSQGYAEKGESAEPKNWDEIAGHWLVVDFLGKAVPPDLYPAADAQAVRRKIDEAVEKRYEDPAFLDRLQWQDLTGSDWKNDDALSVARSPEGVTLSYNGSDPAGLYWLNQVVTWQDYIVQVEFTTDNGFQVLQRTLPGQPAGATHDFDAAIQTNFVKPNERTTSNLWVYMSRFRTQIGDTKGRPAICPPSAPRTGGITIRVPKGTKVTIHKISVKVLASEETEAGPPK